MSPDTNTPPSTQERHHPCDRSRPHCRHLYALGRRGYECPGIAGEADATVALGLLRKISHGVTTVGPESSWAHIDVFTELSVAEGDLLVTIANEPASQPAPPAP